jgi:hypothetical protein
MPGTAKPKMAEEFCATQLGIVREYADYSVIFQNYTRFSPIFCPKNRALCNFLQALLGTASDAGLPRSIRDRRSKPPRCE